MEGWDRTYFATNAEDLTVEEAIRSLERVIDHGDVASSTRVSLGMALDALKGERG
jgi:hypothetical protein